MSSIWIVLSCYACLRFTEGLLHPVTGSNGQTDKIIQDLQRNFSTFQHDMELQLSLIRQKQTNEFLVQNQTITAQRLKILELEQKQKISNAVIMEQNKTIANQDKGLIESMRIVVEQNKTITDQQQKISEMEGRLNLTFSSYEVMIHDVVEKQNQNSATYTNQIRTLNQSAAGLSKQFHYIALSIQDAERRTTLLNDSFNQRLDEVAFTVSRSHQGSLMNSKVVYDKVLINVGNAYSHQTGEFTCPRGGVYAFTWSTMSRNTHDHCYAYIYRNGVASLMTYAYETSSNYEVASNTEIFHLNQGDRVWIQTTTCEYFYGYPHTAFSGWKL